MSVKPTAPAPWATTANYPADAAPEASTPTKVAYPGGQAAIGYRPDENPAAQEDNDWRNKVGQATQYLYDGDFDGPINIDGTTGDFSVNGGSVLMIVDTIELEASGGIEIDGDVVMDAEHSITVAGVTGDYLHGEHVIAWSPDGSWMWDANGAGGTGGLNPHSDSGGGWGSVYSADMSTNGQVYRIPCLGLRPGDRIKRITVHWTGSIDFNPPDVAIKNLSAWGLTDLQTTTSKGTNYYKKAFGIEAQEFVVDLPTAIAKTQVNNPPTTDWFIAKNSHILLKSVVTLTNIYKVSAVIDRISTPTVG